MLSVALTDPCPLAAACEEPGVDMGAQREVTSELSNTEVTAGFPKGSPSDDGEGSLVGMCRKDMMARRFSN